MNQESIIVEPLPLTSQGTINYLSEIYPEQYAQQLQMNEYKAIVQAQAERQGKGDWKYIVPVLALAISLGMFLMVIIYGAMRDRLSDPKVYGYLIGIGVITVIIGVFAVLAGRYESKGATMAIPEWYAWVSIFLVIVSIVLAVFGMIQINKPDPKLEK